MTGRKLTVTKEDILQDMKDFYSTHGSITKRAFFGQTPYSEYFTVNKFGTFNSLKTEAIQDAPINNYRVSKEDLVEDVLNVYEEYGRLSKDFYLEHGKYSRKPIERIFGSFNSMLQELDIPLNLYKDAEKTILLFEDVLGESAQREKTFEWLINDKTGYNMYLDAYFPEMNIALEYHGMQHYEFVPFMEKKEGSFKQRQYRDKLKKKLCLEHGLTFIEYGYKEPIVRQHVIKKLMGIVN